MSDAEVIAKSPTAPPLEAHVNVHKNARLAPAGRAQMVERVLRGDPVTAVAQATGVSVPTVCKWLRRWQAEGEALGLVDAANRP